MMEQSGKRASERLLGGSIICLFLGGLSGIKQHKNIHMFIVYMAITIHRMLPML